MDNVNDENNVAKKNARELHPCLYCSESYGGIGGLKRHLKYCLKNPATSKKKKNAEEKLDTHDSLPCLFCDKEFVNTDTLTIHIKECHK